MSITEASSSKTMVVPDLSSLSLQAAPRAESQQHQQPQQRVLDFIIVEDDEGTERSRRPWGWSSGSSGSGNNAADGGDADGRSSSTSSTGKARAGSVLPAPPLRLPPPPPPAAAGSGISVPHRFRYTDATLQSALFTAGAKPRLAKKVRFSFFLAFRFRFFFFFF